MSHHLSITDLRPRLAEDAYFAPTDNGVYVRGSAGRVLLSGHSSYDWLHRLAPYLDGTRTVGELCGPLSEQRRAIVETIVAGLLARGLVRDVRDVTGDRPHLLSPAERVAHRTEIAFVGQFADSADERFQRYRDTRVLAVGTGPMADAWLLVARRSGLRKIQVAGGVDDRAVEAADVVVQLCGTPDPERAVLLDRLCRRTAKTVLHAVVHGRQVWVGRAGWESVSSRLAGLGASADAGAGAGQPVPPAAAALAANHLASLCFRQVTGILEATEHEQVTAIDLLTLHHTTHTVVPHPLSLPVAPDDERDFLARIARLRAGRRLAEDELARRSVACYDDRLGVFAEIDEHDFAQFPLRVAQVTVSDPMRCRAGLPGTVVACGLDYADVRQVANQRAFELYASTTVDPRRLVGAECLWAYDLQDTTARLVDVTSVFPCHGFAAPARSAVGSGLDWAEAVQAGLLGLCRNLTVSGLATATEPFPLVDLSTVALSSEGRRYLSALSVAGVPVAVHDLTEPLGVPTYACCAGAETVSYTCALTPSDALGAGLREVLLAYQARSTGQSRYAPAAVVPLPQRLRGRSSRPVRSAVRGDDLVRLLAEHGHRPVVVPLDHDPAVHAILPYVVRVVAV